MECSRPGLRSLNQKIDDVNERVARLAQITDGILAKLDDKISIQQSQWSGIYLGAGHGVDWSSNKQFYVRDKRFTIRYLNSDYYILNDKYIGMFADSECTKLKFGKVGKTWTFRKMFGQGDVSILNLVVKKKDVIYVLDCTPLKIYM